MWQFVVNFVTNASPGFWLLVACSVLLLLYIAGTRNYDYFKIRGIGSTKPKIPFLGDMIGLFTGMKSFTELAKEQYTMAEGHGVFGIFEFTRPSFIVRDPEIIKVVAVKEFDNFMNHREVQANKMEPIFSKNLFNLQDQAWRDMRATLSPAFTTSKIKAMLPLISQCGYQMAQDMLKKYAESNEGRLKKPLPTDMKDLFTRMANDVIATAAFGVSCDSFKHPNNTFYLMGKKVSNFSKLQTFIFIGYMIFPKIMQALRLRILDEKAVEFFDLLVHDTIHERREKSIFRPDVLQLLIQAWEGNLKTADEDISEAEEVGAKKTSLSEDDVSAQAVIFFLAGFETVSTVICFTCYSLSRHQDVQKQLREEVAEIMEATGGKPTYEALQRMKYLDAVINESLRLYPPLPSTDRTCRRDTVLPGGQESVPVTVRKGQGINVPLLGLHLDPKYWDEPEKFNPDRFSDENKHKIKPFTYMPFGLGPRICVGQRFALVEVKLALVHLLSNFELLPSNKTKHPIEFESGFNVKVRGGFWCNLKPLNEGGNQSIN